MYYEINVSRDGKHFFATAPRSITSMHDLQSVYPVLSNAFPASDGYELTVTRWKNRGYNVNMGDNREPPSAADTLLRDAQRDPE
ncbi:hypothetical protein P0E55_14430 [Enterococcus faecalis]|uniref:hypothetical protein n=1 Tax=Enterococcus faecalis TaxID=1351 RepID=UPI0025B1EEC7|nr:hypothetical protein [Enterococcus faecalis]MDN3160901.1 hypothetical protein [Enterococcus faecalis]